MKVHELIEALRRAPDDNADVLIDGCGGCPHDIAAVRRDSRVSDALIIVGD